MPATTKGTTGLSWGLSAETGGILQNLRIRNSTKEKTVPNESGESCGLSMYDRTEEISGEWYTTTTAGPLGAVDPAEAVTLASYTPSTGSIYCTEVTTDYSNEDFKKASFTCKVYPLISG